ncbi:MAG: hypothetical protein OQL19_21915 [Gammaproteobacteria bacterium]|nr:hypothetical protein [Gammaproteobacteria bacterium]
MNIQIIKLSLFLLVASFSIQLHAVQDVYEYKNDEGVIEFTDTVKEDKAPEQHIQIEKMTPEQEEQSKQKLDDIIEKDQALDERRAKERQMENELRRQTKRAQESETQEDEDNSNNDDYLYRRGRYPGVPVVPGNPIVRPKPRPLPSLR